MQTFVDVVKKKDTLESLYNTEIKVRVVQTLFAIGGCSIKLPPYIQRNRGLYSLINNAKTGRPYNDNFCMFRCICLSMGFKLTGLETKTKQMVIKWIKYKYKSQIKPQNFIGVYTNEISEIEKLFNVSIFLYKLISARSVIQIRQGVDNKKHIVKINMYKKHCCYIHTFDKYYIKNAFYCKKCCGIYTKQATLNTHNCNMNTITVQHGGSPKRPRDVFSTLELLGIASSLQDRTKFKAAWDLEVLASKPGDKLQPISGAIVTDVPGQKKRFYIENRQLNHKHFVSRLVNILEQLSQRQEIYLKLKLAHIYKHIDKKIAHFESDAKSYRKKEKEEEKQDKFIFHEEKIRQAYFFVSNLWQARTALDNFCKQLIVIGYNTSSFDIIVVKVELLSILRDKEHFSILQKGLKILTLRTSRLLFLDAYLYVSPQTSLAKFAHLFSGGEQAKGVFCYDYLTSPDILDYPIPPYIDWTNSLTMETLSINAWNDVHTLLQTFNPLKRTVGHLLKHYNLNDCDILLESVIKYEQFWHSMGINCFIGSVSLPGVAVKLLSQLIDNNRPILLPGKRPLLYEKIRANCFGGYASVFNRYVKVGETKIRAQKYGDQSKTVQNICSFDFRQLYLSCLADTCGVGNWHFFEPTDSTYSLFSMKKMHPFYDTEVQYLAFMAHYFRTVGGCTQHINDSFWTRGSLSLGKNLKIDSFCHICRTVTLLMGCKWHGGCEINTCVHKNEKKKTETNTKLALLRYLGYNLYIKSTCEWTLMKKDKVTSEFLNREFPERKIRHPHVYTNLEMITDIQNGVFFGLVEVDITTPSKMRSEARFEEFAPIFCVKAIGKNNIGKKQKKRAEKHDLLQFPQNQLITCFSGCKILLTTPLLQFYLKLGLKITKIYSAIRLEAGTPYKRMAQEICRLRNEAKEDPSKAPLAQLVKLAGNSIYGKLLQNVSKYTKTEILTEIQTMKAVKSRYYRRHVQLDFDLNEVVFGLKTSKVDVSTLHALFCLQHAKRKMLSAVYTMYKYVDPRDLCFLGTDTDSLYLACTFTNWQNAIPASKMKNFLKENEELQLFPQNEVQEKAWGYGFLVKEYDLGYLWIAPCPKTYFLRGFVDEKEYQKHASKGINQKLNSISEQIYYNAIYKEGKYEALQKGFMKNKEGCVYRYESKKSLKFFLTKRKIDDNDPALTSHLDGVEAFTGNESFLESQPVRSKKKKISKEDTLKQYRQS